VHAVVVAQEAQGAHRAFVVVQRLADAPRDDVRDLTRTARDLAGAVKRGFDLARRQVTQEPELARREECTGERAPDLRRDAQRQASLVGDLYLNRYDRVRTFLTVGLRDTRPGLANVHGVGARVRVRDSESNLRRVGWIQSGGSWHASQPAYVHFGLGAGPKTVDVKVRWPDAVGEQNFAGLQTGACWILDRVTGATKTCRP
jgi:hypothetical protein